MHILRTGLLSCKQNNARLGLEAACCLTGRRLLIVLTVFVAASVDAQALLTLLFAPPAAPFAAGAAPSVPIKIIQLLTLISAANIKHGYDIG